MAGDIARWQELLAPLCRDVDLTTRRKPIGQLVKSLISGRTRDAMSLAAYHRLGDRFGSAGGIADAEPWAVEAVIADATFARAKAEWLVGDCAGSGKNGPTFAWTFSLAFHSMPRSHGLNDCPVSGARSPRRRSTPVRSAGRY